MSPTVYTWTGRSSWRVPVGTHCARSARAPGSGAWSRKGRGSPPTSPSTPVARCASSCEPAVGYRTDPLSPLRRSLVVTDPEAAGTPILLIHGIMDNRSVFTVFRRALRRRGFGVVHAVNYGLFTGDLREAAHELRDHVERLCEATGADKVHIVGHSLGGVIARYYVQRMGGSARVDTLVTLGSPHSGTLGAYLIPTALGRQLRPGSPPLTELARARARLHHAVPGRVEPDGPDGRAAAQRPAAAPRPRRRPSWSCATSATWRCPIDGRVVRWVVDALCRRDAPCAPRRPTRARCGRQPGVLSDTPDPDLIARSAGSLALPGPDQRTITDGNGSTPNRPSGIPSPAARWSHRARAANRHREGQVLARHRSPSGAQEDDPERTTRLRAGAPSSGATRRVRARPGHRRRRRRGRGRRGRSDAARAVPPRRVAAAGERAAPGRPDHHRDARSRSSARSAATSSRPTSCRWRTRSTRRPRWTSRAWPRPPTSARKLARNAALVDAAEASGAEDAHVIGNEVFVRPALGAFTSGFGARWGVMHYGIDIANAIGTPIYAFTDGVVEDAGPPRASASGWCCATPTARTPCTGTSTGCSCRSASRCGRARRSPRSATAASPPARTCTSRSGPRTAPRSTRCRGSRRTGSG